MSSDLEKFLQQAAERLRDKIQQSQAPQRSPQTPPPIRPSQRPNQRPNQRSPQPQSLEPLVVEANLAQPRQLGEDPLSSIDTRPSVAHELREHLAEDISQADERMAGRVHQVFDHSLSTLPSASTALQPTAPKLADQTNTAVEVNRRGRMSSPFLRMLRKPDTLRAAFIAGEIFRRKF